MTTTPWGSWYQNTHYCPGRCGDVNVPNRLYSCGPCWRALPRGLQRGITGHVIGSVEHAEAMLDASHWFADHGPHRRRDPEPSHDPGTE